MCSDEREVSAYKKLFQTTLKDFHVTEGGQYCGFSDSANELEGLLEKLNCLGYSYKVRTSSDATKNKTGLFFQYLSGNVPIPFTGPAFRIEAISHRQCVLGPKYYKKKETFVPDHLVDHVNPQKKRRLLMDTKKSGCPATLSIKTVRVFKDYCINSINESRETKKRVIDSLKKDLTAAQEPVSFLRYYVVASSGDHHTHTPGSVKVSGAMHHLLAQEILNMVRDGTTSVPIIKMQLETFIQNHFTGEHKPDRTNTMFYPTDKVIYNHVQRCLFKLKNKLYDQEALQDQITRWNLEERGEKIFFRPYSEHNGQVQSLLFCYQNGWQIDLLRKYGNTVLLDATYKTTKYDIPLFFLVVKTNVLYLVVGIFFVQVENIRSIEEALQIFKKWNPDWNPTSWMTDFSEAEISAIEAVFPQSTVHLCAFHRGQAWSRWLNKVGNLTVRSDAPKILNLWSRIAASTSETQYRGYIEIMKNSDEFVRNKKALSYFQKQWLPEHRRWVKAFEPKGHFAAINTTNGVESLNRTIKHVFLKHNSDRSLTGVVRILVNRFLPSLIRNYCVKNSVIKPYSEKVPIFLHNKTPKFIHHVMGRYSDAETQFNERSVMMMDEGLFCVKSAVSKDQHYIVNFSEPSCSCADFQKSRYLCKHFCAVFIYCPGWDFHKVEEGYRTSPLICLDETYGFGLSSSCTAHTTAIIHSQDVDESSDEDTSQVSETPNALSSLASRKRELREICKHITNLTYNCCDAAAIDEALEMLKICSERLEKSNPVDEGLPLVVASSSKENS